ncbi:MAG: MFS transporter [Verrucomicrobia bacterium]|nr:MFS transporter [Verrucomicrobiota bacterium]
MSAASPSLPLKPSAPAAAAHPPAPTVYPVLFAISLSHGLNDTIQALLPALFPVLKDSLQLSFAQLGWITFAFFATASVFQPLVGWLTDRRPMPRSLPLGMTLMLIGLLSLAGAGSYGHVLLSAVVIGLGSAIFHPEASRVAYLAAGPRRGLAQSLFQVGGNAGNALGPLLAAAVVVTRGQGSVAWFSLVALAGMVVLWFIGNWQRRHRAASIRQTAVASSARAPLPPRRVALALGVLVVLIFSKYIYLASMTNYYVFYLIHKFGTPVPTAQVYLFVYLAAIAAGTILGGPIGDRIGRRRVIWASILGVAPFSLALPYVGVTATVALTVLIGLILASAFSAIVVYAQELLPGKVGMIAGLFFGLAFGTAGLGSAGLGQLADRTSIEFVFEVCAWLPLIGLLTVFLPEVETAAQKRTA